MFQKSSLGTCLAAALLCGSAWAQDEEKPKLGGSIEHFFTSGGFGEQVKTRDRFTRFNGHATWGKWEIKASYWNYPFCQWYELDENTISYSDKGFSWKYGRFLIPFGQTNWDDEWYSGFVFIPMIEFQTYGSRKLLERTSIGTEIREDWGPHSLRVSMTGGEDYQNKIVPGDLNRLTARYTHYQNGLTLGASYFVDTQSGGKKEQMMALDARYTMPQWTFRGEIMGYQSDTKRSSGWFVDAYHRPKGWQNVTFIGRWEGIKNFGMPDLEVWTLGAKIRLPHEWQFMANYGGGPDMNSIFLGGNWSFGLNRTFKF